jgi:hypothetical protein
MSKKSKWDGKIPINPFTGNVPHYNTGDSYVNGCFVPNEMIYNRVFRDTLYDFSFVRGRSAAYVEAHSIFSEPTTYNIFLHDFEEMIPLISCGRVTADFTYCKRGANYGTKLAKADSPK